jgi:hypothetical protein
MEVESLEKDRNSDKIFLRLSLNMLIIRVTEQEEINILL